MNKNKKDNEIKEAIHEIYNYAKTKNQGTNKVRLLPLVNNLHNILKLNNGIENRKVLNDMYDDLKNNDNLYDCRIEVIATLVLIDYFELLRHASKESAEQIVCRMQLRHTVRKLSDHTLIDFYKNRGYIMAGHLKYLINDELVLRNRLNHCELLYAE